MPDNVSGLGPICLQRLSVDDKSRHMQLKSQPTFISLQNKIAKMPSVNLHYYGYKHPSRREYELERTVNEI